MEFMNGKNVYIPYKIFFLHAETNFSEFIQAAVDAKEHSYCPYSKFRVGAAVLCLDGTIFSGKYRFRYFILCVFIQTKSFWIEKSPPPHPTFFL